MAQTSVIVAPHQATRINAGDKGYHLARLSAWGEAVPAWFAVAPHAMQEVLQHAGLDGRVAVEIDRVRADAREAGEAAKNIQQMFLGSKFAFDTTYEISQAIKHYLGDGTYAVRSSVVETDGAPTPPGLFESLLYQRDEEDVCRAILHVWASAHSERALLLQRDRTGGDPTPLPFAVLVQDMVDVRSSGILNSVSTKPLDPETVHIQALWGTGEGLTAGLPTDQYHIAKRSEQIKVATAQKTQQVVRNTESGSGLMRSAVPETHQGMQSLGQEELLLLNKAARRIETGSGRPQEIEFVVDTQGQIFILQRRDLHGLSGDGPAAGHEQFWGTSTLHEGLNHGVSPLGFSILRRLLPRQQQELAITLGVPWNTLVLNQGSMAKLIGLVDGRVVHNLAYWQRHRALLNDPPAPVFDDYTGLEAPSEMSVPEPARPEGIGAALTAPFDQFQTRCRRSWNDLTLSRRVDRFRERMEIQFDVWNESDIDRLRPHELIALYENVERLLVEEGAVPLLNDHYTMRAYADLQGRCIDDCNDVNATLQNDLLCGIGGFAGTEATWQLTELAQTASLNPDLKAELLEGDPAELAAKPPGDKYPAFAEQLQTLLFEFGHVTPAGPRIGGTTWREDPRFVFQVLQNYLQDDPPPDFTANRERAEHVRVEAEALLRDTLGPWKRFQFRRALIRTRKAVRNRDGVRHSLAQMYGFMRRVLLRLGHHLEREGLLNRPEDVVFLTIDELRDFVRGSAIQTRLGDLIHLRRAESEAHPVDSAQTPQAGRFKTFGMVYHRNQFTAAAAVGDAPATLRGTGACPGIVRGQASVVDGKHSLAFQSQILVARSASPDWAPLFPSITALVLEHANPLSHSVLLARELGIPTVTGVPNVLEHISSGEALQVNGNEGTILRLEA